MYYQYAAPEQCVIFECKLCVPILATEFRPSLRLRAQRAGGTLLLDQNRPVAARLARVPIAARAKTW